MHGCDKAICLGQLLNRKGSNLIILSQSQSQSQKVKVKVSFIVNSATCTLHTYRELKLCYSLTPWCIQITLNTNSRTQNTDKYKSNIYIYIYIYIYTYIHIYTHIYIVWHLSREPISVALATKEKHLLLITAGWSDPAEAALGSATKAAGRQRRVSNASSKSRR